MAELARKYQNGIGCPRDIGRALLYYKRAASQGDTGSMVELGDLYREGVCVPRDLAYATGMYQKAADAGFAPGMMRLGEALESSGRREEGIVWFRKAAAKGYGPAMTHLGDLVGDPEWYRRAVAAKDPAAFAKLSESVASDEAVSLLRQGAELGDPVAQSRYGLRIEKSDPAGAAKLFQSAAEAGNPAAMARLAEYYERGLGGLTASAGEALLWYTKASKEGEPSALYWFARREEAAGRTDEARALYKRGVAAGHAPSMARLAVLNGDRVMLQAAASAGDVDAIYEIALETHDDSAMRRAAEMGHVEALARTGQTEKAADRGHVPSMLKLGRIRQAAEAGSPEGLYRYGLTIPDKAEGTRYVQRAAEGGFAPAMRELALRLESGSGVAADPVASKEWFSKAADAGDPEALFRRGDEASVLKSAEGGYAPAMAQVAEKTGDHAWLEKAAATGYAHAWTKLGDLERGAAAGDPEAKMLLGEKAKNSREAYRLFREAADAGYAPAMRRVGDCTLEGRGTSTSPVDAVNWYRKAARAGDHQAMEKLKSLGKTL
jgi:TPR repeat protein